MSTPEENLETAVDESSDEAAREEAIETLETANACDKLAAVVREDGLDEQLQERAIEALATPQCTSTLEELVDDGDLPESLRERAESLLEQTPEDVGAGP